MQPSLQILVETKTVPGTLLFCGADGAAMLAAAKELALALMGPSHTLKLDKEIHPDYRLHSPQGKVGMHPMESMRGLIGEVSLPPFEAPVRLFVIDQAHRMLPTSSNALLKTLEEPTPHTYIILITSRPEGLLPTIISRARRIDFARSSERPELNPLLLELLSEPLAYADQLTLFEQLETEVEAAEEGHQKAHAQDALFEQILTWYRDRHLIYSGGDPKFLSYPEHLAVHQSALAPPSWDHLISLIETCRLALQRSMKLRVVLEHFFLISSL